MSPNPPKLAERLVRWSLAHDERPAVLGDLLEEFEERRQWSDEAAATRWYWRQAITSLVPNLARRIRNDEEQRIRKVVLWGVWSWWLIGGVRTLRHRGPDSIFAAAIAIVTGVAIARARRPSIAQQRVLTPIFLGLLATVLSIDIFAGTKVEMALLHYVAPALSALFIGLLAWPRWPADPPPREFFVRQKPAPDEDPWNRLTVVVPNDPLALSGLVVTRAPANGSISPAPIYREQPMIDRTFDRATTLRFHAAIKTSGAGARVTCDVLDDSGDVVRSWSPVVHFGDLVRIAKPWARESLPEALPGLGRIDLTLSLADLAPGAYRIRLTTTEGIHTAQQEERIDVRGPRGTSGNPKEPPGTPRNL